MWAREKGVRGVLHVPFHPQSCAAEAVLRLWVLGVPGRWLQEHLGKGPHAGLAVVSEACL